MNPADKPQSAADIDKFVCAELPTENDDAELRALVERCMVHGPCGALNPQCVCMSQGVCSRNYPKEFQEETVWCSHGYPKYRRREFVDGKRVQTTNGLQDNRWVVPYNKILLKTLKCHINVEVCTSIKAVKYLYKYTYKGPDRACLEKEIDEVTEYLDTRYVTAPEACWRLFEYPMHEKSHVVERLPVHLPNEQVVLFQEGRVEEAIERELEKKTKLEAWYELNCREQLEAEKRQRTGDVLCAAPSVPGQEPPILSGFDPCSQELVWPAKNLRYGDIPDEYVWDNKNSFWKRRQKRVKGGEVIGRMYQVSPKNPELYALRLLLLHVTGKDLMSGALAAEEGASPATVWSQLKIVAGHRCSTFQEAARLSGLMKSDQEIDFILQEMIGSQCSMSHMCDFFALLLIWHEVGDARELWEHNWRDFAHVDLHHGAPEVQ